MDVRRTHRTLGLLAVALALVSVASGCRGKCKECQDEKCSDLVAYCKQDADCKCMAQCSAEEGLGDGVSGCLDSCGLDTRPNDFIPVHECMAVACPDNDECASDGVVPDPPGTDEPGSTETLGAGDLDDCSFDDDLSFDANGAVLQLQSEDQSICVRVERRNDGPGSLANTEWTLLEAWVGPLGGVSHVDTSDDLCWYSSHHNFADWAHVWTGERYHAIKLVENGHGGARSYELHSFELGSVDPGSCPPTADGELKIGNTISLTPYSP